MAENSTTLHEAETHLTPATRDLHRAIASLMEELEAVDWYQQRIDAAGDGELRQILEHNRNEEIEHAAMVLEWIRRRRPEFDARLRIYLFTEGSIVGREGEAEPPAAGARNGRPAASIGSLREAR